MKVGITYQTDDEDETALCTELLEVDEDAEYFKEVDNPTWELLALALQTGLEESDVDVDLDFGLNAFDN